MPLQSLPNELLGECFAYLETSKPVIKSLRLVSKRIHALSSPYLLTHFRISFDRQSAQDLDFIAKHPIFSRSISSVSIDVSYYDRILAESLRRFAEHSSTELYYKIEVMERTVRLRQFGSPEQHDSLLNAFCIIDQWEAVVRPDWGNTPEEAITEYQKLLLSTHGKYVELFTEQEKIMAEEGHFNRLIAAFQGFNNLKKIVIEDYRRKKLKKFDVAGRLSHEGLEAECLEKSRWKGSFRTAMDTQQPMHLIARLFKGLAGTSIRPQIFEINLTAPADMRCINLSTPALDAVCKTLSRAERCYLSIKDWQRRGSLVEDIDRSAEELIGLCNLTTAFFSSKYLKEMHLGLDDYPAFGEFPQMALPELVKLPLNAPSLSRVYFRNVPLRLEDIREFVTSTKELEWLNLYNPYLLSGTWVEALDALRKLEKLSHVEMKSPRGCEFGVWREQDPPEEEVLAKYILRESEKNPLIGWADVV
ncbi:hypothetical protein EJ04DRAFT_111004 [Polyplosphaeria fusca]|uniref:F-box domain-containing protein n=1 Tax=Polyplosphaeria fusca TaxID=682080 RepID=A0A9P4RA37_9PLEO|nr:hypothetical protein EJ04DRAFT_111004 [Polyplosphaeria fusca]